MPPPDYRYPYQFNPNLSKQSVNDRKGSDHNVLKSTVNTNDLRGINFYAFDIIVDRKPVQQPSYKEKDPYIEYNDQSNYGEDVIHMTTWERIKDLLKVIYIILQ